MDVDSQKLMLDVLRQDALLSLSYVEPDRPLVGCALEAWGGRDDLTVSPQHVTGWRDYADGEFQERMFPGGHYFCLEEPSPVLNLLGPMARWSPIDTRGSTR
jgi:surfactin synthase thioesterase subunit